RPWRAHDARGHEQDARQQPGERRVAPQRPGVHLHGAGLVRRHRRILTAVGGCRERDCPARRHAQERATSSLIGWFRARREGANLACIGGWCASGGSMNVVRCDRVWLTAVFAGALSACGSSGDEASAAQATGMTTTQTSTASTITTSATSAGASNSATDSTDSAGATTGSPGTTVSTGSATTTGSGVGGGDAGTTATVDGGGGGGGADEGCTVSAWPAADPAVAGPFATI